MVTKTKQSRDFLISASKEKVFGSFITIASLKVKKDVVIGCGGSCGGGGGCGGGVL